MAGGVECVTPVPLRVVQFMDEHTYAKVVLHYVISGLTVLVVIARLLFKKAR